MTPEEARGRQLARRSLVGLVWFLVEAIVLVFVIRLAGDGRANLAFALGVFLILLSYFEGRARK
jgi:hypothetical protein